MVPEKVGDVCRAGPHKGDFSLSYKLLEGFGEQKHEGDLLPMNTLARYRGQSTGYEYPS